MLNYIYMCVCVCVREENGGKKRVNAVMSKSLCPKRN
jgi:hypothetical protein